MGVLWKMGPVCILVTMGWKNWFCDNVISPIRMNGLKTACSLLKGRGRGETHVTLIQEMNSQWEISFSVNCLQKTGQLFKLSNFIIILFLY